MMKLLILIMSIFVTTLKAPNPVSKDNGESPEEFTRIILDDPTGKKFI